LSSFYSLFSPYCWWKSPFLDLPPKTGPEVKLGSITQLGRYYGKVYVPVPRRKPNLVIIEVEVEQQWFYKAPTPETFIPATSHSQLAGVN